MAIIFILKYPNVLQHLKLWNAGSLRKGNFSLLKCTRSLGNAWPGNFTITA
jgi:hypothetical protein